MCVCTCIHLWVRVCVSAPSCLGVYLRACVLVDHVLPSSLYSGMAWSSQAHIKAVVFSKFHLDTCCTSSRLPVDKPLYSNHQKIFRITRNQTPVCLLSSLLLYDRRFWFPVQYYNTDLSLLQWSRPFNEFPALQILCLCGQWPKSDNRNAHEVFIRDTHILCSWELRTLGIKMSSGWISLPLSSSKWTRARVLEPRDVERLIETWDISSSGFTRV